LGLMAVGAGLRLGAVKASPALAGGLLAIRHLAMPAAAIALCWVAPLPPLQQTLLVAFAAMPTASSCYVLAVRMGGNGPYVAALVTLSTCIGMLGLPLALGVLRALST
jgi:malonate transporter and related proteins